jgi:cytidylate kinase
MSVITISREAGSGGTAIAESVAKALGYALVDKQTVGSLLAKYGLIDFGKVYDDVPAFWDSFDSQKAEERQTTLAMMNKVLLAFAKRGDVVIVGRGGYIVLGGYADVLNVRIQAPLASRIANIQRQLKISDYKQAEKDVRERDRIRVHFMESAYSIKIESVSSFDFVLNADKVSAEKATAMIADIAKSLDASSVGAGKLVSNAVIDPVLGDAVGEILGR